MCLLPPAFSLHLRILILWTPVLLLFPFFVDISNGRFSVSSLLCYFRLCSLRFRLSLFYPEPFPLLICPLDPFFPSVSVFLLVLDFRP